MPKKAGKNHFQEPSQLEVTPTTRESVVNLEEQHEVTSPNLTEAYSGWCLSEDKIPRAKNKPKTRFHRAADQKTGCECQNYYCHCGPDPALEAIEDERARDEKLPKIHPKPTNASVLRDAAILLKEDQKQQEKILELLSAPRTYLEYEKYLEEARAAQEREELLELERKHLSGQLSYEEAILAKKKVVEENAKKHEEYLEEKAVMEEELQAFREKEMAKVKDMVREIQEQHENAKRMQEKTVIRKKKAAQAMNRDIQEMLRKRIKERELEIERKIAAIRELKILQKIKKDEWKSREEQMTKLVGVSVEELKARLALLKRHMREELMKKKTKIHKQKCRKEIIREAASNFIKEVKNCRMEMKKLKEAQRWGEVARTREHAIEDEQVKELRTKLEQARMRRQSYQAGNRSS